MAPTAASAQRPSGYLSGPVFDGVLIIFAPAIAVVAAKILFGTSFSEEPLHAGDSLATILLGTMLMAHLVLTFARSHGNSRIFWAHPWRFTLVPLLLLAGMLTSTWFLVFIGVLTTCWDEWHSGAQTFGLCRIYESRAGNDPREGRRLDLWMNMVVWLGPLLGGVTLIDHATTLGEDFESVSPVLMEAIPYQAAVWQRTITQLAVLTGVVSTVVYIGAHWRMARRGARVSVQKVALMVTTGAVSIYAWGFHSIAEAFFVMNVFHYPQYFGLVWLTERENMLRRLSLAKARNGTAILLFAFLAVPFSIGLVLDRMPLTDNTLAFFLLLSLLHFWYDGFIWSVRRKMV